jgi:hypothetical protein
VNKIHPVWFEYNGKAQLPMGIRSVGIVAQEMQKIAPYIIGKYKSIDSVGKTNEYLDYNANLLFYLLVNSVKELSATNDGLPKTNDELKNTVSHQQEEIDELKTMVQTLQQSFSNCNPCANGSSLQSTHLSSMAVLNLSKIFPIHSIIQQPLVIRFRENLEQHKLLLLIKTVKQLKQ